MTTNIRTQLLLALLIALSVLPVGCNGKGPTDPDPTPTPIGGGSELPQGQVWTEYIDAVCNGVKGCGAVQVDPDAPGGNVWTLPQETFYYFRYAVKGKKGEWYAGVITLSHPVTIDGGLTQSFNTPIVDPEVQAEPSTGTIMITSFPIRGNRQDGYEVTFTIETRYTAADGTAVQLANQEYKIRFVPK